MDCQMYQMPYQQISQMPIPPQPFRSEKYESLESKLESKFNMYERQIDQLFEFAYQSKDDIQLLFKMKDQLSKSIDITESNISTNISELKQYKECIINYYQLELENKRRMVSIEFYQFLLFIVQIVIILALWLIYKL